MDKIAMDALNRGWRIGFGTVVPRRDVPTAIIAPAPRFYRPTPNSPALIVETLFPARA